MKSFARCALILAATFHFACTQDAHAWGLKTHVWISQEVLNEVLADGHVTLGGRRYKLPEHVYNALRIHPERYRMGSMGPDVFPDPVVGQSTTHRGVDGGWQTDEWLKHVLRGAQSPEEIAFAYGFVAHAAGDIFAHTYVNAYAGDIFNLKDEREVERRHFVLEKYIEALTPHPRDRNGRPIDWSAGLGTATSFLRRTLILDDGVAGQYSKAIFGLHLSAMLEVRNGVRGLDEGTQKLIGTLTEWGAVYFKAQTQFVIDLALAKPVTQAAEMAVKSHEELLKAKKAAYAAALDQFEKGKNIVQKHPELITFNQELLAKQVNLAAEAAAD
jgi:Zinc dependent phospholipase C